jgi:ATP adenylyltransferase
MNKLWAPWRIGYITKKKEKGCIFCNAVKSRSKKDPIIFRTRLSIAMLNKFPYNNGHIMVCPIKHTADLNKLTREEVIDLFIMVKKCKQKLDKILHPHGYNMGFNLGMDAGAGITDHLHVHIVPRYRGDMNFMPVISNLKVIPQSLEELARILKK